MPALSGQVISTLRDGTGTPIITATWFFNPATGDLVNSAASWTAPSGKVYAAGSCLIVDNGTNKTAQVVVNNPGTGTTRTFNIAKAGQELTVAQMASIPAPNGPVTTAADLNGLTFNLS